MDEGEKKKRLAAKEAERRQRTDRTRRPRADTDESWVDVEGTYLATGDETHGWRRRRAKIRERNESASRSPKPNRGGASRGDVARATHISIAKGVRRPIEGFIAVVGANKVEMWVLRPGCEHKDAHARSRCTARRAGQGKDSKKDGRRLTLG